MENTVRIQDLINNYNESRDKLKEALRGAANEIIAPLFKDIFEKHQGLKVILIHGYTPSFNDGEPCEHSQNIYIGRISSYKSGEEYNYYIDYDGEDEELEALFAYNEETHTSVNSGCLTLDKVSDELSNLEEVLGLAFGTNFQLIIKFNEGEVSIDMDDYDCEY